jgi:ABC-type nitrate/sulfonate/bicarbonate transport system permease component
VAHVKGGDGLLRLLPILALLVVWELIARSRIMSPFLLPRLTVVIPRIESDLLSGSLLIDVAMTLQRAFIGYTLAAASGIAVGIAMAESKAVHWFFDPIVSAGFPMPKIAFVPIFMLWLGLGDASKIALVMLACFFIIATNSYGGATGVDKHLLWAARSLGANRGKILRQIILPAATPQVLTGLQIALPMAVLITVASEMLMGGGGIGGRLLDASRFADSVGLFAGIVEIALLGTVLIRGFAGLRRHLLRWHAETQMTVAG